MENQIKDLSLFCLFTLALFLKSALVLNGFPPLLEHLSVPDEAGAGVSGQLEILRQLQAISRTCFLTEGAEHTARRVEDELIENFFAARLARNYNLNVHRNDIDTVLRTGQCAQIAGDTKRIVRFRIHV